MRPTARRFSHQSLTKRLMARRRGGFTLVEMMVSVTLVMLMMLMFAEIFGLATETISKQKGIATNDQKARILAEVLRTDLENRTFRSVYPFKLEDPAITLQNPEILTLRRGYFSYSENDPNSKTDDVLQFTIEVAGQIFGKASVIPGDLSTTPPGLTHGPTDGPSFDDGRKNGPSGASQMAEVSYYFRDGNLYRSVLLIRKPYFKNTNPGWGKTTPENFPGSPGATPAIFAPESFWNNFDYSVYRETTPAPGGLQFHGMESLSNNPDDLVTDPPYREPTAYLTVPDGTLWLPHGLDATLGAPQLRFGHSVTGHGQPFEFSGAYDSSTVAVDAANDGDGLIEAADWNAWRSAHPVFIMRFNSQERSDPDMTFPGQNLAPFGNATPPTFVDANDNGIIDTYEGTRRGVDLMLPNVQGFDVEVWDDILGQFVNLGYGNPALAAPGDETDPANAPFVGTNPYTGVGPQFGFYHISRLRESLKAAAGNYITDAPSVPADFGNRYDTWCPNMWIVDAGGNILRNGRAPYRPFQTNPDPNTPAFNNNLTTGEPSVAMGDMTLDDNRDGSPYPTDVADTDAEAPLRAIRITVHYLDPHSGQTRQATIEQSLVAPIGN